MNKWTRLNKEYFEVIILLIPFLKPNSISMILDNSILNRIFIFYRVLAFVLVCIKYFGNYRNIFQAGFCLIALYEMEMLVSVLINREALNARLIDIGNALGVYMIYSLFSKKSPMRLIDANFNCFSFLIVVNALITLIYPRGLNQSASDNERINFLGMDNFISCYFVFGILLAVLYLQKHPQKKRPYIVIGIVLLNELFYLSGAGIVAVSIFLVLIMLINTELVKRIFCNPSIILIGFIIIEVIVVFLQNINRMGLGLLFNLLGKESTFSDRIFYWRQGIKQFLHSPLFGTGSGTVDLWGNDIYSHNAILDVLLKGGVIGAVLWIIMVFYPLHSLLNRNMQTKMSRLICVALIPFLLIGMMEGLEDRVVFNMYVALTFNSKYIIPCSESCFK